jgi:hypothetical protein
MSNTTLKQIINYASLYPNTLISNNTVKSNIEEVNKRINELNDTVPSGHSAWGTGFSYSYDITAGFAKQYLSPNLNLGSTPNEDKVLYAPTITLPQPCPFEVSTRYWYSASSNTNYEELGIFDFYVWSQNGYTNGWTNVHISMTDSTYVFDIGTARPYYYVEIQYYSAQDQWIVYLWNRVVNNWEVICTENHGYSDTWGIHRLEDGWDFSEFISPGDNGYDNSFAGVDISIQSPIESNYIMVYYQQFTSGWAYASSNCGCYNFDSWPWTTTTPFAQSHYFNNQFDDWIVRSPAIFIDAWDPGTYDGSWYPVQADVYIDGNYVGQTGNSFTLSQNTQHTVEISYTGTSLLTMYFGGYEDFMQWFDTGSSDNARTLMTTGSDIYLTGYYYWSY